MTLEGMYHGPAANLNTAFMGVDVLAGIFDIPIGSDDISQLHSLSDEASGCFSRGYTTRSTQQERWRSFNETTTCLVPVVLQALGSKAFKLLLSPVILVLEGIVQLAGYLEAAADIATGNDTPTTTIDATPIADDPTPTTETGSFGAISAGGRHSCGLRTNGTITCWGDNSLGQADAPSGSFNAVTAGGAHACGLRIDGTITCWSDNSLGQADAPSGSFGNAAGSGRIVTLAKGGPGPTSVGQGEGVPCAPSTPTCRYLNVQLSGFAAGTYTVACRHDGWGSFGPSTFWTFSITVDASGSASSDGPCFLNFAELTGNGAYVTVSSSGTETIASNWLR